VAKRKKKIVVEQPKVKELEGYRLGDIVYAKLASGDVRKGEITKFHPKNIEGPAFTFLEEGDGKYLVAMIEWVIEKPTAAQKKKALKRR
jgi:hypothetical protein